MKIQSRLIVMLMLFIASVFIACGSEGGGSDSGGNDGNGSYTGAVTLTGATAKTNTIDISWTDPSGADFDYVKITWSLGSVAVNSSEVDKGVGTYSITGLTASIEYDITLTAVNTSGTRSATPGEFSMFTTSSGEKVYSFIYTVTELDTVRDALSGNYILMADLDLNISPYNTGTGWTPICGENTWFTGTFNGNNHVIKNLYIYISGETDYTGLFAFVGAGAYISNLGLVSANVTGDYYTGGLAGSAYQSNIVNCYVTGQVTGTDYETGGLIGFNWESSITNCCVTADVKGTGSVGGLIGQNQDSTITECYATGSVTGTIYDVGGLVGLNYTSNTIKDCYARGVIKTDSGYVGGLVGSNYPKNNIITNCYAAGSVSGGYNFGGFAGYNNGYNEYNSCFYDKDTSGFDGVTEGAAYGTAASTTQMKTSSTFTGASPAWDFTAVWNIDSTETVNGGYPYLRNTHQ